MNKHTTYKDSFITNSAYSENQYLNKVLLTGATVILAISIYNSPRIELVSPCPTSGCIPIAPMITPTPSPTATPSATPKPAKTASISGLASYYSRAGCIGCDPNFITASGDVLDDNKLTMALPPRVVKEYKLMGKYLKVTNMKSNITTNILVNDTGGFSKYGRIADLSLAAKKKLECTDICNISIDYGL